MHAKFAFYSSASDLKNGRSLPESNRYSKISQLDEATLDHEYVLRLDVTVQDLVLVQVVQGESNLH